MKDLKNKYSKALYKLFDKASIQYVLGHGNIAIFNAKIINIDYNNEQILDYRSDKYNTDSKVKIIFMEQGDEFIYIIDDNTSITLSPVSIDRIKLTYDIECSEYIIINFLPNKIGLTYYNETNETYFEEKW